MLIRKFKKGVNYTRVVMYRETMVDYKEKFWSFSGAFIGLGLISYFQRWSVPHSENLFLIGSFGASSVLVYGAIHSPLSQPRNLIGGHVVSAVVGVTVSRFFPPESWIAGPLAVATSIIAMQFIRALHPPGGATALIAVLGSEKIKALGYWYVLSPVLSGALLLLAVALIFNNITPRRKYPTHSRLTSPVVRTWRKILQHKDH